jgi:hypothetical protein
MIGQIAGAAIGGLLARQGAKSQAKAMDRANAMMAMGYTDARPYIQDMYRGGTDALNRALDLGYYGGDTYTGMNQDQLDALTSRTNVGRAGAADASGFMDLGRGFGQNYSDIFDMSRQNMLDNATSYATANTEPLLRAAMRDPYRELTRNTLPGINRSASASGNTNSSRAGIAEALAQESYDDRSADMAASIQDRLMGRSLEEQQNRLANMTTANQNLAGVYNTGFGLGSDATGMMLDAGGIRQRDEQNQLDDARMRFEGDRDFALDMYNEYNAGILGRAPQTSGPQTPNLVDPNMAMLSGGMAGFGFGRKYLNPMFAGMNRPAIPQAAQVYGSNMGSMGMGFGNNPYGF